LSDSQWLKFIGRLLAAHRVPRPMRPLPVVPPVVQQEPIRFTLKDRAFLKAA